MNIETIIVEFFPTIGCCSVSGKELSKIQELDPVKEMAICHQTRAGVLATIPAHCHILDFRRSMLYTLMSVGLTALLMGAAHAFLPVPTCSPLSMVLWAAYATMTGTVAFGIWVIGHECGHNAFCATAWVGHVVGYICHSILLVPYFSWRRSHQVHHAHTNHITDGETHVPHTYGTVFGSLLHAVHHLAGGVIVGLAQLFVHLVLGWPAYLLFGATGSPQRDYGLSNHFLAWGPQLFPRRAWLLYCLSTLGVVVMLGVLYACANAYGTHVVIGLYAGPLMVSNAWLVMITWLQHTDVHVPHMDSSVWTWAMGASQTIDRPYHWILDLLHHRIGTTHQMHHFVPTIPHYHAVEATAALRAAFPAVHRFDPTPILTALWRVASTCVVCYKQGDGTYRFTPPMSRSTH